MTSKLRIYIAAAMALTLILVLLSFTNIFQNMFKGAEENTRLPSLQPIDKEFNWEAAESLGDDASNWYEEVRWQLDRTAEFDCSNPGPEYGIIYVACDGPRAGIGRTFNKYITGLINLYRITRHQDLVDEVERLLGYAKINMERFSEEKDLQYRQWNPPHKEKLLNNKEDSLAEGHLPQALYVLYINRDVEGYQETVDYWLDYLINDFQAKYAEVKDHQAYKGFPSSWMMHPYVQQMRHLFYMDKLVQAGALDAYADTHDLDQYRDLFEEMANIIKSEFRTDTLENGEEVFVWSHGVRQLTTDPTRVGRHGITPIHAGKTIGDVAMTFQMGGYVLISMEGIFDLAMEGAEPFANQEYMEKLARTYTERFLLDESSEIKPGFSYVAKDNLGVCPDREVTINLHHSFINVGGIDHTSTEGPWFNTVDIDGWTFKDDRPYSVNANIPCTAFRVMDNQLFRALPSFFGAFTDGEGVEEFKNSRMYKVFNSLYYEGHEKTNQNALRDDPTIGINAPAGMAFSFYLKDRDIKLKRISGDD